jgi:hypothetical protein
MPGKLETAKQERRKSPRAKLPQTVRVRPFDFRLSEEVCTTANVSRTGFYMETSFGHYYAGMNLSVARNFQRDDTVHREETGKVTRVEKLSDGKWGVAIRIL